MLFRCCACLSLAGLLCGQITTSQYDNARTGANVHETVLTPKNVNGKQFGRLFKLNVDGDVYAQPLLLPGLAIPEKGIHDVLFVATERDSVYAFDAGGRPSTPLWKASFANGGNVSPVEAEAVGCPFISPEIGITSTPVIDQRSATMYVLARTAETDSGGKQRFWQRLHALDVLTGEEKFGGPVTIRASVGGSTGLFGMLSGSIGFAALHENPRASLTLAKGAVYLTWASSCDVGPYHGWIMAYDAHTLKQVGVFNTSPDAVESGIWQSDTGPAVDNAGNLFVSTGNGRFDANSGGHDYGDSLLKVATTHTNGLTVSDYFTPSEQAELNSTDGDLGSGGPLLIPEQPDSRAHLVVVGGKGGVIYVINRDHMGKFVSGNNPHAVQTIKVGGGIMGAPAYWSGHLFYFPSNDYLDDFAIVKGRLSNQPVARGTHKIVDPGATPSVSANGTENGIVWVIETKGWRSNDRSAVLTAYDASNVRNQIYTSEQNEARDGAGTARRFVLPVVSNGRVYVPTSGEVDVYGLLSPPQSSEKGRPK